MTFVFLCSLALGKYAFSVIIRLAWRWVTELLRWSFLAAKLPMIVTLSDWRCYTPICLLSWMYACSCCVLRALECEHNPRDSPLSSQLSRSRAWLGCLRWCFICSLAFFAGMGCWGGKNYRAGASSRLGSLNSQSLSAYAEWIAAVRSTVTWEQWQVQTRFPIRYLPKINGIVQDAKLFDLQQHLSCWNM